MHACTAGSTALIAAVRGGHAGAVAALLKAGALPLQRNYADVTALDLAQVFGFLWHEQHTAAVLAHTACVHGLAGTHRCMQRYGGWTVNVKCFGMRRTQSRTPSSSSCLGHR